MSEAIAKQLYKRRMDLGCIGQGQVGTDSGMSQQQYQRIETTGNCKTKTLERICDALNLEIALIPKEKADLINAILNAESPAAALRAASDLLELGSVPSSKVA